MYLLGVGEESGLGADNSYFMDDTGTVMKRQHYISNTVKKYLHDSSICCGMEMICLLSSSSWWKNKPINLLNNCHMVIWIWIDMLTSRLTWKLPFSFHSYFHLKHLKLCIPKTSYFNAATPFLIKLLILWKVSDNVNGSNKEEIVRDETQNQNWKMLKIEYLIVKPIVALVIYDLFAVICWQLVVSSE